MCMYVCVCACERLKFVCIERKVYRQREIGTGEFQVARQCKGLPVAVTKVVSAQLCLAVNYLHMRGIIHRDVKVSTLLTL